jgi:hypothetical protein
MTTKREQGIQAFHSLYGSGWCEEGTAHRSPVSPAAVRHLLVEGERLWCSGGKGRPDNNPHSRRYCPKCLDLAREYREEYGYDDE